MLVVLIAVVARSVVVKVELGLLLFGHFKMNYRKETKKSAQ